MKTTRILVPLLALFGIFSLHDARAALFVTKASQGAGANWTAAIWSNAPSGTGVAPAAGNTYELIDNGTAWGNSTGNSRTRNPATDGLQTFPGDSLTVNANTDIRFKRGASTAPISLTISHFPGVGGAPGLILNGGILNPGDDSIFIATGRIHVASQSILSSGDNGGGAQKDLRAMYLRGTLTGTGNLVILQSGVAAHQIDANATGYIGNWIIQDGFLQGLTAGSLGRGGVTLSPTNQDPASVATNFSKFEPMYDWHTPGTLTVNSNTTSGSAAIVVLHQDLRFARVFVDGVQQANGTYPYAVIAGAYPTHIAPGGSGSISIGPATPTSLSGVPGDTVAFLTWTGDGASAGYIIKRAPGTGGPYTPIATNGTTTSYLDTGLVNGTPYFYVVSAINDGGESTDSNEATVTPAIIAPVITADPQNSTNCTGSTATFSGSASGGYPVAYQWYFNTNTALANQTNATLTINNVQLANAGTYALVATNTGGSVTSAVALLVIKAATVASTPASSTNCPGTAASFSTTATGAGTLTYTWRKGAAIVQGPDGNSSYSIASVVAGDAGAYSVTVAGDCNSVSNNFTLVVAVPPIITAQPQNQTTPLGNGAAFSVTAIDTNTTFFPLTYQWQTNGVDVTGATGTTFAISNLTLAANGMQVRAVVTDCAGSTTSSAATLSVSIVSGISFDFNTPGQFTNAPYYLYYNNWINSSFLNGGFANVAQFEMPFGGVGPYPGSGSVDLHVNNNVDNTSVLLPVAFDFSLPGKTLFASTMFKVKTPITAGRRSTQLGFVTATNIPIADVSPQGFMSVIVQDPTANSPSYELHTQRRTTGGGLQESTVTGQSILTVSNWYRLNVAFTNTKNLSISNFAIGATLQDMGPLGTTPGAIVLSFTTATNNADIVNATKVYLAIRSFEDGGVEQRDDTYVWTTPGNIFFVQEPQNQTILKGNRATFASYVDGEGPYTYVWQRDNGSGGFTNIPGAGSWNLILPPARTSDNGAQFRVVVTGPANTITSAPATLTVTPQTLAVVGAGSVDGSTVGVEFNQPVNVASAQNVANYTINGVSPKYAQVYRSSLGPLGGEGIFVVLTPVTPIVGAFTVVATGVQDLSGGAIGGANSAAGSVAGLTGYDVNSLTGPPGENYSFGTGKFIVKGGGSDIFSGGDGFRFVYKQQTGDFDVIFKVPYMDTTRFTAKAGVDARFSLDPFSPGVFAGFDPGPMGEAAGNVRQFTEGTAKLTWGAGGTSWGANPRLFHPNVWIRLRRAGNNFIRYSSVNGVNWTFDGQIQPFTAFDDQPTLYLGLAVCAARNLFSESAQFESFGTFAGYVGSTIAITTQPANFSVAAGASSTATAVATLTGGGAPAAAGELAYVWQRSNGAGGFTNLPTAGQTNNTLSIGPLFFSDNGAQYRVLVQAPGAATVTSAIFTATVTDTAVPTVAAVNPTIPNYQISDVTINFSEPVTAASATNVANYTVTNAAGVRLTVLSATLLNGDPRTVVLKVDSSLGLGTSSVGISGLVDLNNNALGTQVRTFRTFATSYGAVAPVVVEYYQDIGTGADITALTANAMYTAGQPSWISYSNVLGANTVSGFGGSTFPGLTFSLGTVAEDNYGIKAYTYFIPPTNGQYKFWIRADDFAALYMNTNSLDSTNPAGKVLLESLTVNNANYTVGTAPASSLTNITLVAGQAYYMEFLFKETGGGDGGSVMWTDPTVNAAPAQTVFIPTANLAYPDAVAPKTPVISEFYVGYTATAAGNGNLPTLTSATNAPAFTNFVVNNNIEQAANWKYIAGIPDFVGYQKYFAAQPQLGNTRVDNYMGRLLTYFVPPSSGNYKFYMRSDDAAQFYMNTNAANSTDASGKKLLGRLDAFTSAYTLVAQNVPLVGGQRYYMETLWREGGGGDGVSLAVRAQSDASVPPIGPPPETIPASMLEYPFEYGRSGAVDFTGILPANPIASEGQSLTLTPTGVRGGMIPGAGFGTDSPRVEYGYIWYRNGVRLFDSSFTNITPRLTMADNGAVYTLVMTNMFSSVSRSVTLTVVPDTTAPVITRTVGWRGGDGFTIKFNEEVDPATATYLGNYMVNNGLQLLSATLDPSGTMLSVRTTPQALNTTYTIAVNGVRDISASGNPLATNVSFTTWGVGGSGVLVELFTNIVGSTIGDLTGAPKFAANLPDVVYYTNNFGVGAFGANTGLEFYGARVTALFVPTNTGYYRFYLRQDDAAELFMNINSSNSEDPNGKIMIHHSQGANISFQDARSISQPIFLNGGQRYYMEALFKEGTGGDYMLVTFRNTDANGTAVGLIPPPDAASEIMGLPNFGGVPGNPDDIQLTISSTPPTELFVGESDQVNLSVGASVVPPSTIISYQWARSNANSGVFTNIPGVIGPTLSFFARLGDDGAAYRVTASVPGTTRTYATLLHVTPDTTAPFMVSANSLDGNTIGICYNEPVDVNSAGDPSNYYINGDTSFTPVTAVVRTNIDPRTVILTLSGPGVPLSGNFTVDNLGVGDLASSQNFGLSQVSGSVQGLIPLDVGAPLGAGSTFTCTNTEMDVIAGGADIWGTADQGHMVLGTRTGNFDIWAQVASLSRAPLDNDGITKAGIMVRETLNADARKLHFLAEPPATIGGRDIIEAGQRPAVAAATAAWFGGNGNNGVPAGIPNTWVRIKRVGNLFTAYRSADGVSWVPTTTHNILLPNTLYIGLAATAHIPTAGANPTGTTLAKFRNVHIPNPPTITVQPSPVDQTVALHAAVSYSVTASNPAGGGTLTYQWKRNGFPVTDATNSTFSLASANAADSGIYTVDVANDGGAATSVPVTLTVNNGLPAVTGDSLTATQGVARSLVASSLLSNDSDPEGAPLSVIGASGACASLFRADFNTGLPAGTAIYGTAYIDSIAGNTNSGVLKLTDPVGSQLGSFIVNDLSPGAPVAGFTVAFKIRVAQGSGNPADGFSVSFANDLPNGAIGGGEEGGGTGLIIAFDNYDNGGGEAPAVDIKWNNAVIVNGHVGIPKIQNAAFQDVLIRLDPDGTIDVSLGGNSIYNNLPTPYTPITGGRFGFSARTGGELETHWIDDLSITVVNRTPLGGLASFDELTGLINYTPPSTCGIDSISYLVSDGQQGGTTCGTVTVNVVDGTQTAPTIVTCASDHTYTLYTNTQFALPNLTGEVVASDTCGTPIVTQSPVAGTLLNEGTNTVTFTATDSGGLTATCQSTVIVQISRPTFIPGSASYGGGTFSAQFQTANGVNYRIEYTDSLNTPITWNLLTTVVGDGTVKTISDPGPLPPMRFYRIVPQP